MKSNFVNRVADAFSKAKVVNEPFQYRIIQDALDQSLFDELAVNANYNFNMPVARGEGHFAEVVHTGAMANAQQVPNKFWQTWTPIFMCPEVREIVLGSYGLMEHFENSSAFASVHYNRPGVRLGAHTDYQYQHHGGGLLALWQIYLPMTSNFPHLGTSFFRDEDGEDLIETVPFLPNWSYSFSPAPNSWHGMTADTSGLPFRRVSLMIQFCLNSNAIV